MSHFCTTIDTENWGKILVSNVFQSSTSVYLSWEIPVDEGGQPMDVEIDTAMDTAIGIVSYGKTFLVPPSSSSYVVTRLMPGTIVKFCLRAVNPDGERGPTTYARTRTISGTYIN